MTNNKQQTPVEWLAEKTFNQIELLKHSCISEEQFLNNMLIFREQAKEMEVAGKEMSYSDGYKQGYYRAIENAKYQINKWIDKELKITQQ
jgi:hypothetical protein